MLEITIHTQIESEDLHLPEVKPLIGKNVEIIVREEAPPNESQAAETAQSNRSRYESFLALARTDVIDPISLSELRSASML